MFVYNKQWVVIIFDFLYVFLFGFSFCYSQSLLIDLGLLGHSTSENDWIMSKLFVLVIGNGIIWWLFYLGTVLEFYEVLHEYDF